MEKPKEDSISLQIHSGQLIISNKSREEFFLARYDSHYRITKYRNYLNFIGGACEDEDSGPRETMEREVHEEVVDPEIAKQLLLEAIPFADYLFSPFGDEREAICSVYYTVVKQELLEKLKEQIKRDKKVLTEGLASVVKIEDIQSGKEKLAWNAASVMRDFLGDDSFLLRKGITTEKIGMPLSSFRDYEPTYSHKNTYWF